jgi:hypothetical protein
MTSRPVLATALAFVSWGIIAAVAQCWIAIAP